MKKHESKTVMIGEKFVGANHPVYIVFEAGPTHDGLETAIKLVDMTKAAGADAVKFQILKADRMVSSREVMFSYTRLVDKTTGETELVTESLLEILKRREMRMEEWRELIQYCHSIGVEFFSTVSDEEEVRFLAENGVHTVKICSGDVSYHHLLRETAKFDLSVQLDTGSSSIGEVEFAVDVLEAHGCHNIILNHCPSGYPAHLEGINLRVLPTLQQMFPYPVAFSDHSAGYEMDIAAVALGANMIEKTITLDRTIRGPEHIMSLEPGEAKGFVQAIRDLEVALGNTRRKLGPEEKHKRLTGRRSLFAAVDIAEGSQVDQGMLAYSRPGDGISAEMDQHILGRKAKRMIPTGTKLCFEDFA